MKLDFIATLANENVRLRFLAMERSLRRQGCNLPVRVIPFDNNKFDLPDGSEWWDQPEFFAWLENAGGNSYMRKYLCLAERNYHFIDTDVVFLKDPSTVLNAQSGFVTCCTHWHNPGHTQTDSSLSHFMAHSTTWQKQVFNAGQFACDQVLWGLEQLKEVIMRDDMKATCLSFKYHDQPGVNLLVLKSGIKFTNLTLPPSNLESSWAGDYPEYPHHYWDDVDRMPYLIHWAGLPIHKEREIDHLFVQYFSPEEMMLWRNLCNRSENRSQKKNNFFRVTGRRLRNALVALGHDA